MAHPFMGESQKNPLLQAAFAYVRNGWHVIPLWSTNDIACNCPKKSGCISPGKHPRTTNGEKDASNDSEKVFQWWDMWPDSNIGIATGTSDLFAVDVDTKEYEKGGELIKKMGAESLRSLTEEFAELPSTYTVMTPSGGWHHYFQMPEQRLGCTRGEEGKYLGADIDTRGDGGYVVAPPSVIFGKPYSVSVDMPPASLPAWVAQKLQKPARASYPPPVDQETGEILESFQGTPESLKRYLEGRFQVIQDEPIGGRGEPWVNGIALDLSRYVPHQLHEHELRTALYAAVDTWQDHPEAGRAGVDHGLRHIGTPEHQPRLWKEQAAVPTEEPEAPVVLRRLKLTPASAIEPEPVIWAWEPDPGQGRIPAGALTLAAGREGTGKSSFGIWLAAQLSRGTLPGTFYGTPRNVLYAAVEDSWSRTLVPRLMAAGADLDRVFRVDVEVIEDTVQEAMVCLPMDVSLIEGAIKEHAVAALIVDPLMSTLGRTTDAHRTQDVRQALEPLVRMAERTRALTLGIAHFSKASGTDAAQLVSGSGAFKDLARALLAFARDRESEGQVMTQVKNSLGRLDLPNLGYLIEGVDVETPSGTANVGRLAFTGPVEMGVEDMLSAPLDAEEAGERTEAAAWLLGYLTDQGGEAARADVMKAGRALSFSEATIKRARIKAKVTVTPRSGFGGGTVWQHPDSGQSAHSQVSQLTSQSPEPTEPTGDSVSRLRGSQSLNVTAPQGVESGPCTRCQTPTRRYGAGAHPHCDSCRAATEETDS